MFVYNNCLWFKVKVTIFLVFILVLDWLQVYFIWVHIHTPLFNAYRFTCEHLRQLFIILDMYIVYDYGPETTE